MKPVKVSIENFQSIEKVDFEIDGFSVLVGKTNIGKSAIIRAISSALMNDPVVGMVRKDATSVKVEISSDDYHIEWERGEKGVNRTKIDGKLYDKTGSNQLEAIETMGFGSVEIGGQEVFPWHASQFSPVFLLDRPGGQVTEFISEISRLNVLQDAIAISARQKLRANAKANEFRERVIDEEKTIKKFDGIQGLGGLLGDMVEQKSSIEATEARIKQMEEAFNELTALSGSTRSIKNGQSLSVPEDSNQEVIDGLTQSEKHLNVIKTKDLELEQVAGELQDLPEPIQEISDLESMEKHKSVDTLSQSIYQIPKIDLADVGLIEYFDQLSSMDHHLVKTVRNVREDLSELNIPGEILEVDQYVAILDLQTSLDKEAQECKNHKLNIIELDQNISTVSDDIKTTPTCPTCEQVVNRD